MNGNPCITEVACGSASDFLAQLRAITTTPEWGVRRRDRWAFRGQMNSNWKLVPSAFRHGNILGFGNSRYRHSVTGHDLQSYQQGQAEFHAVYQFLQLADRVGLVVPGDNPLFRLNSDRVFSVGRVIGICDWPPPEAFEILAIAQHHGVPTRLLDFTYSYLVAAWFSANKAATDPNKRHKFAKIAVWALDMDVLFLGAEHNKQSPFTKVTVPRAGNSYLHAQEGFFLLCNKTEYLGNPPCFESVVASMMEQYCKMTVDDRWPGLAPGAKAGYKVVLDANEAHELLELLHIEGIDEAHLFPSLDNVFKSLAKQKNL